MENITKSNIEPFIKSNIITEGQKILKDTSKLTIPNIYFKDLTDTDGLIGPIDYGDKGDYEYYMKPSRLTIQYNLKGETEVQTIQIRENGHYVKFFNQTLDIKDGYPDIDFETGRANLYKLIEKGNEAIDGILNIAKEGEHPRAYEVAATTIKSVADTADKLIDLQHKMKKLKEEDNRGPSTVNNSVFIGSTADLQKLLKKGLMDSK